MSGHPPNQEHPMSAFHRTIADNVKVLFDWHDKQHLLYWPDCPESPCQHLDSEFRKVWSK